MPVFEHFIKTINIFCYNQNTSDFNIWINATKNILDLRNTKKINQFISTSYNLLNNHILYNSDSFVWQIQDGVNFLSFEDNLIANFDSITLICYSPLGDTIKIKNTSGSFDIENEIFNGNSGILLWERVGYHADTVFATTWNYKVDVSKPILKIDTISFYNHYFFSEPIVGNFIDRLVTPFSKNIQYPQFQSFNKYLTLGSIADEVEIEGGFASKGEEFYVYGNKDNRAKIYYSKNDTLLFKTYSDRYLLLKEEIISNEVAISLIIKSDSIYHPKLTLKYDLNEKQLTLYRKNEGLSQVPFNNSYHKIDMFFELMTWNYNEERIRILNLQGGEYKPAYFVSQNYFRSKDFNMLTGLGGDNPIIELYKLALNYEGNEFSITHVSNFLKVPEDKTKLILMDLAVKGYLDYDQQNQKIYLKNQLFNTVNANAGRIDYDVISLTSFSKMQNASLSLINYDLEIGGLTNIALSDSQNVRLFPYNGKIIMSENRNFQFDGLVKAGRFNFYGHNFKFDYEGFRISMQVTDSMKFRVPTNELIDYNTYKLINVKTVLQDLAGELFIDHPYNKSGKNNYPYYPVFKSAKESYVFYDEQSIYNGVYHRDKVYFKVEPFELDSLDNFKTETLVFNGIFESSGMFPTFKENLKVQNDFSLGFIRDSPSEGYPIYSGKGVFTNRLSVSNEGIIGEGTIGYLTSLSKSDKIYFFPDSVKCKANEFTLEEQLLAVEYPYVSANNSKIYWLPLKDEMYITSVKNNPAKLFKHHILNVGTLILTPNLLRGNGSLEFLNSYSFSDDFYYKNNSYSSNDMEFKIKRKSNEPWVLELASASGEVNFNDSLALLNLNNGMQYVDLPVNKYICATEQVKWMMDKQEIQLRPLGGLQSELISTHPLQDSLNFNANEVDVYLNEYLIKAHGVDEILVADAILIPDSGNIKIYQDADIEKLINATLITDIFDEFHSFVKADIKINSKHNFLGSGTYPYNDNQNIYFKTIGVDSTRSTFAKGYISKDEYFYITPFFKFYGNVNLFAQHPFLIFEGNANIVHTCDNVFADWFAVNDTIDPELPMFNLSVNDSMKTKYKGLAGVYTTSDSLRYYSTFLSPKRHASDKELISNTGYLFYDDIVNEYVIESKNLDEVDEKWITFDNKNCLITASGHINLYDNKDHLNIQSYGFVDHDLKKNELYLDATLGIDFFFDDEALSLMGTNLFDDNLLSGANIEHPTLMLYMNSILGEKESKNAINDLINLGEIKKYPEKLKSTFVLTEVEMIYDRLTNSFISINDFSALNFKNNFVGRSLPGIIEVFPKRTGTELYFLFEVDESHWYFFQYKRNLMQVISSSEKFNSLLRELPQKKRVYKSKQDGTYQFMLSTKRRLETYLYRFE